MKASKALATISSSKTWKTLYLVSATSAAGGWLWKVGITKHDNPLKRNPKQYSEVFRAVRLPHLWAFNIELHIAQTFNKLSRCPEGREYLTGDFGLEQVCSVYDFWLNSALNSECYPQEQWEIDEKCTPEIHGSDVKHEKYGMNEFDEAVYGCNPEIESLKALKPIQQTEKLVEMW